MGIPTVMGSLVVLTAAAVFAEEPPLPVFEVDIADLRARCAYEVRQQEGWYRYEYRFHNKSSNTVGLFTVDFTLGPYVRIGEVFHPPGWDGWLSSPALGNAADPVDPTFPRMVPPFPFVGWLPLEGSGADVAPGQTSPPFGLYATLPPCLGTAWVQPWLDPWFELYFEQTGEEYNMGDPTDLELANIRKVPTLVPLLVRPGSLEHWDRLIADVGKLGELGWVQDGVLLAGVQQKLKEARQAASAGDLSGMSAKLDEVIAAVGAAGEAQMWPEAKDLVLRNAENLKLTGSPPPQWEPRMTLAPELAVHRVGEEARVVARYINAATSTPVPGALLKIQVVEGPHAGTKVEAKTDAEGKLVLAYRGMRQGIDRVTVGLGGPKPLGAEALAVGEGAFSVQTCGSLDGARGPVAVKWEGGADLEVPLFVPPVLISSPGRTFYLTETTRNIGDVATPQTITRYYMATERPVDPSRALVVGERVVPALAPGESSAVEMVPLSVPSSLPPGTYYLDACADAAGVVVETDENNNCASSGLNLLVGAMPPPNRPPECGRATAQPAILWPPNHRLEPIALLGVSDPDDDAVTLTVTGISQDEPTNGLGDGDQAPDGFGVGSSSPAVRAERAGGGNGRVYRIRFTGSDGKGGVCSGFVVVGVPHERNGTAVDDGKAYDSTR